MVDPLLICAGAVITRVIKNKIEEITSYARPTETTGSSNDEVAQLHEEIDNKCNEIHKLHRNMKKLKIRSSVNFSKYQKQRKKTVSKLARKTKTKKRQGNHIGIFGLTSTGKSTMVNSLLGKQLADVGVGETTKEITPYQGAAFTLWDAPGRNDESTYLNNEYISFIKGLTRRLILVQYTIKENSELMQLLDNLSLNYDIIVNKFDDIDQNEQPKFQSQIKQEIISLKLKQMKNVFFLSAKYPKMFSDWLKMVDYLTEDKSSDNESDEHTDSDSSTTSDSNSSTSSDSDSSTSSDSDSSTSSDSNSSTSSDSDSSTSSDSDSSTSSDSDSSTSSDSNSSTSSDSDSSTSSDSNSSTSSDSDSSTSSDTDSSTDEDSD